LVDWLLVGFVGLGSLPLLRLGCYGRAIAFGPNLSKGQG